MLVKIFQSCLRNPLISCKQKSICKLSLVTFSNLLNGSSSALVAATRFRCFPKQAVFPQSRKLITTHFRIVKISFVSFFRRLKALESSLTSLSTNQCVECSLKLSWNIKKVRKFADLLYHLSAQSASQTIVRRLFYQEGKAFMEG